MFCEACYHLAVLTQAVPGSALAPHVHSLESEFRAMDDQSAQKGME